MAKAMHVGHGETGGTTTDANPSVGVTEPQPRTDARVDYMDFQCREKALHYAELINSSDDCEALMADARTIYAWLCGGE